MKEQLLKPLKLNNTGFYGDHRLKGKPIAKGYGGDDSGKTTYEKKLTWALLGQGGMVASSSDLYIWFDAVLNHRILEISNDNLMLKVANKSWLLGNLRHFDSWGAKSYYAGGSTDFGYTALAQYLPEKDIRIILLLNQYNRKYKNATHQKLSKEHLFPILLNQNRLISQ